MTTALLKKFMDLPPTTSQFSQPHGEEQRKHTQLTDSRTQASNGLIHLLKKTRETLVIRESMKQFMDLSTKTTACTQPHIQENNMLLTELRTQNSNTCIKSKTLETQSTCDQMYGISLMRILDQSQSTEERLHQSTLSNQENLDKELKSSHLVQVAQLHLHR